MNPRKKIQRTGAATVEFAITLPVLFLLIFGSYELSRANMIMHTCEAAAYEGARVGIVPGSTSQEVADTANSVLSTAGVRNATVELTPNNLATTTDFVSVRIEVDFSQNSLLTPLFIREPFVRTCELKRERLSTGT